MVFDKLAAFVIQKLVTRAHTNAREKGFHDKELEGTEERYRTARLIELIDDISADVENFRRGELKAVAKPRTRPVERHDCDDDSMLMLMVTEISEARAGRYEYGRSVYLRPKDGKPEGEVTELADIVIRVFDYAGKYKLNLGAAILQKMAWNKSRPKRHGGKRL